MQENKRWSIDCGDVGIFDISDAQKEVILRADSAGARFVDIGQAVVNIAFIRGMVSYTAQAENLLSSGGKYKDAPKNEEGLERLRNIMREKGFKV